MSQQENLKAARAKIEAIFKEHDIAGYVTLHGPGYGEVFWSLWPSYSIIVGDFPTIRIKSLRKDYPSDEAQGEHIRLTVEMVHHLATTMGGNGMAFLELATFLDAEFGATHSDKEFEPDPGKLNPGVH